MCVSFVSTDRTLLTQHFELDVDGDWPSEIYQDYLAPIIRLDEHRALTATLASFSMIPKRHSPPGVKRYTTMNARSETVGSLRSYSRAWRTGARCLVPMTGYYEPCYESGAAVRWHIGVVGDAPFAVAGLWRPWQEQDGNISYAFTQLTINADEHPLMSRMHRPGEEKRSLVIVPKSDYQGWLECDPEVAHTFLRPYPADLMAARPKPLAPRKKPSPAAPSLFD